MINAINQWHHLDDQMGSLKDLKKLLRKNHGVPVKFFLVLNAPFYTQDQINQVLSYFKDLFLSGLEGVICTDVGLMEALKIQFSSLKINASLGTQCLNSETVKFFKKLGVARIVLERTTTVTEAAIIRAKNPNIELEVFIDQAGCPHIEDACTHHHGPDCVCVGEIYRFAVPQIEINNPLLDPFLKLHSLFKIGIDYLKIQRHRDEKMTASEMLQKYEKIFSFIRLLNKYSNQSKMN